MTERELLASVQQLADQRAARDPEAVIRDRTAGASARDVHATCVAATRVAPTR